MARPTGSLETQLKEKEEKGKELLFLLFVKGDENDVFRSFSVIVLPPSQENLESILSLTLNNIFRKREFLSQSWK